MFGSSELSLAAADSYRELDSMLREAAQRGGGGGGGDGDGGDGGDYRGGRADADRL